MIMQTTDPNRPLQGHLQGIGFFDGMYDNIRVTNNVVIVTQYHGIALYGVRNAFVANNTVVGSDNPWLAVVSHKDGTPSTATVINNLTGDLRFDDTGTFEVSNNMEISNHQDHFLIYDPTNQIYDLRLKATSSAINAGSSNGAPTADILGNVRDSQPDCGAYEAQ